jgi:hypothetical protein
MPNIGVKQTESAARQRVVSKKAVDVLNILAFVEIFYLQYISFNLKYGEMMAEFRPKDSMVGASFTVERRIFSELKEVVYTERDVIRTAQGAAVYTVQGTPAYTGKESSVRVETPNEGFFVSGVEDGYRSKWGEDRTGFVCFAVKMDPKKFPKQSDCRNGILIFRMKNGQEYKFQCEQ